MSKKSYTVELVRSTHKAVLCIPSEKIAKEVYECGHVTGRNEDKAEKSGIQLSGKGIQPIVN